MEFDVLQDLWRDLGGKAGAKFERRLLDGLGADHVRSNMTRLELGLWLELIASLGVCFLTGGYLFENFGTLRYAIPGLALHGAVLTMVVLSARQLYAVSRVDYSEPVVVIQRRLAELRVSRVRSEGAMLIAAPLLWTPLAIVGAHGVFGLDLYAAFGAPWIVVNFGLGVAVLLLAIWLSRRYGERARESALARRVADGLAGRSLVEAQRLFTDVDEFAAEA
ncbi:MAG: hypothetical protein MJB57_08515 [Gemmatimonadetes bacterium]|nr:hypothetical protein [Gemmatimonadota bacterium]